MIKEDSLNHTLYLVRNAIDIRDYPLALRNAKALENIISKHDIKYSYLASLEHILKHLYNMYANGGTGTDKEKSIQFAESYLGMLKG